MRSALTMLGIIIGVGAVIAMIAVGSGAKAQVTAHIASIGSNLIIALNAIGRLPNKVVTVSVFLYRQYLRKSKGRLEAMATSRP